MRKLITLDFSKLRTVAGTPSAKTTLAKNSTQILGEYINMLSNLTEYCNELKEEEIALLTMSLQSWMIRRTYTDSREQYAIGDIFHTDLGMTYSLECAYPHPVIILEEIGNMLLVVPATTSTDKVASAYHPTINPTGNKFLRRVEDIEDGFTYTSAILLSNVRTISKGRLLNKIGQMHDITNPSSIFREIKKFIFEKYTPREYHELEKLREDHSKLEEENKKLEQRVMMLMAQLDNSDAAPQVGEKTG